MLLSAQEFTVSVRPGEEGVAEQRSSQQGNEEEETDMLLRNS